MRSRTTLACLTLLVAAAATSAAPAGSLIERVPASAAVFGVIDFDSLRKSPFGGAATSAATLSDEAGRATELLARAGIDPRRDFSEVAFAVLPQQGDLPDDMAFLAKGTFNAQKLQQAVLAEGGKHAKLGSVSAVRMPATGALAEGDLPLFLSFLDGALMMGSAEATKVLHAHAAGASSARRPADVPASAAFWLAGDLGRVDAARSATSSVPMAAQVQRVILWGLVSNAVELHAVADATEPGVASQLAGLAQLAAGFAAMRQDADAQALLSGLKVSAQDRRVTASLRLSEAQIARMRAPDPPMPAKPTPPPPVTR